VGACPSCGRENPADAHFCNACGAALAVDEPERETLAIGGKPGEAADHAATAMEILDAKGYVTLAGLLRKRLAAVGVVV